MKTKKKLLPLLLALLLLLLCACAGNRYTYSDSQRYTSGGGQITGHMESIEINWIDGRVRIATHDGSGILLSETASKPLNSRTELHWYLDGTTLHVAYAASGVTLRGMLDKELTVLLPEELMLKDVHISAVSADIEATGLKAESLVIQSVSGSANVSAAVENAEASAVSGNVTLALSRQPAKMSVNTVSGCVTLYLPENAGFTASVDTLSGHVRGKLPFRISGDDLYVCGDGSSAIRIDTVSGDVYLEPLQR